MSLEHFRSLVLPEIAVLIRMGVFTGFSFLFTRDRPRTMSTPPRHLIIPISSLASLLLSFFISVLVITNGASVLAEDAPWVAPADDAAQVNPVSATPDDLAAGEAVYKKRCTGCHGETGKGDGPDAADLAKTPAKFSTAALSKESDGALFWKISNGRKPMPKYGTRLTPTQIWQVIHYIRTFSNMNG